MKPLTITLSAPDFRANRPKPITIDFDVEVGHNTYVGQCTVEDSAGGTFDDDPSVSSYWRERVVVWDGLLATEDGKARPIFGEVRANIQRELDKQLGL